MNCLKFKRICIPKSKHYIYISTLLNGSLAGLRQYQPQAAKLWTRVKMCGLLSLSSASIYHVTKACQNKTFAQGQRRRCTRCKNGSPASHLSRGCAVIIAAPVGRTAIILADDAALVLITTRLQCAHSHTHISRSGWAAQGRVSARVAMRLFRFGWHSSRGKNPS